MFVNSLNKFQNLDDDETARYLRGLNELSDWKENPPIKQTITKYCDDLSATLACYVWLKERKDESLDKEALFHPQWLSGIKSSQTLFDTVEHYISPNILYGMFARNNISQTREDILLYRRTMMDQIPETNHETRETLDRIICAIG